MLKSLTGWDWLILFGAANLIVAAALMTSSKDGEPQPIEVTVTFDPEQWDCTQHIEENPKPRAVSIVCTQWTKKGVDE